MYVVLCWLHLLIVPITALIAAFFDWSKRKIKFSCKKKEAINVQKILKETRIFAQIPESVYFA